MKRIYTTTLTLIMLLMATLAAQAQQKSTFVHMKSGEIKEIQCSDIDSITFADHVKFDFDVKASHSVAIYQGSGQYVACLSDQEMDSDGLPTKAGQVVVLFYAFGDEPKDYDHIWLPSGVYTASTSMQKGTLYNGSSAYLYLMYCTEVKDGEPYGYGVGLDYATMKVKNNEGQYYIDFRGGLNEREDSVNFKDVHMVFEGKIDFQNDDPAYYYGLTKDYNVVPTGLSGRYTNGTNYGNYSLAFYNVPLDKDGFVVGEGELINVELLTKPGAPMNISNIAGEYKVADVEKGPYQPGVFLSGVNYYAYGMYFPMGTYLNFYDKNGEGTHEIGFAKDGTVKCTVDGDKINFDFNIETENGKHFTMKYTGSASDIIDYSSSGSAKQHGTKNASGFMGLKGITRNSIGTAPAALQLIKQ